MNEIVDRIIYTTETILKCRHDESLMETNAPASMTVWGKR